MTDIIDSILRRALCFGASDVHFEARATDEPTTFEAITSQQKDHE